MILDSDEFTKNLSLKLPKGALVPVTKRTLSIIQN